ncbi:MAG: lytic transglycosylase domain-containing protein [Desulfomonile tiedjei]|nr:lytic transglycosylase domain-containing protein [Desulfomonile tiedjei]
MKRLVGLCILLSLACFVMFAGPALRAEIEGRRPLLPWYYINKQLASEIAYAESRKDEIPPRYEAVIREYASVQTNRDAQSVQRSSLSGRNRPLSERVLARMILWQMNLPSDFFVADPVQGIVEKLSDLRRRESSLALARDELIEKHLIDCVRHRPSRSVSSLRGRGSLPLAVIETGLVFCGEPIPLERSDVRQRIEHQIDYLLNDLRDSTGIWLKRKDRYGQVIDNILSEEGVPEEFCLLPALESGYSCTVASPSLAKGWWQFVKPTAVRSLAAQEDLDWTLRIDHHVDERKDLALSTRAAARYLKWMRSRLGQGSERGSWLTAAAAYNAGLDEVQHRIVAYGTRLYWDMKLPLETEHYVPRWIAFAVINGNRGFYGLEVPEIVPLSFDTLKGVRLAKDLPLSLLATATESSVRFVRELNSSLDKRETSFRATKAEGGSVVTIHIPKGSKSAALKAMKSNGYLRN